MRKQILFRSALLAVCASSAASCVQAATQRLQLDLNEHLQFMNPASKENIKPAFSLFTAEQIRGNPLPQSIQAAAPGWADASLQSKALPQDARAEYGSRNPATSTAAESLLMLSGGLLLLYALTRPPTQSPVPCL